MVELMPGEVATLLVRTFHILPQRWTRVPEHLDGPEIMRTLWADSSRRKLSEVSVSLVAGCKLFCYNIPTFFPVPSYFYQCAI